jgi:hypothetical protein
MASLSVSDYGFGVRIPESAADGKSVAQSLPASADHPRPSDTSVSVPVTSADVGRDMSPRSALKRWEAVEFTADRNSDGPMRVPTSPLMGGEPLITAAGALFTPPFFRPGPITINKNGIIATFNEKNALYTIGPGHAFRKVAKHEGYREMMRTSSDPKSDLQDLNPLTEGFKQFILRIAKWDGQLAKVIDCEPVGCLLALFDIDIALCVIFPEEAHHFVPMSIRKFGVLPCLQWRKPVLGDRVKAEGAACRGIEAVYDQACIDLTSRTELPAHDRFYADGLFIVLLIFL